MAPSMLHHGTLAQQQPTSAPACRGGSSSSSPTRTPRFLRKRSTRGSQEAEPLPGPNTPSQADRRSPAQAWWGSLNAPPKATRLPLLSQPQENRPAPSPKRPSLPLAVEAQLVRPSLHLCAPVGRIPLVLALHGCLHLQC